MTDLSLEAFKAEATAFLDAHATPKPAAPAHAPRPPGPRRSSP